MNAAPPDRRFIQSSPDLAAAPGPISQAVVVGDQCYVSGQLAVDRRGVFRPGTTAEEAEMAFGNLDAALRAAGFAMGDLAFVEIVMTDLSDLPAVNALFARLFAEGARPARTVSQAAALPYGGKIKVHGVAVRAR